MALFSYKDMNSSSDLSHKTSRTLQEDSRKRLHVDEKKITYQLNSKVVTAVVSNPDTKKLSDLMMLTFTHEEVKKLAHPLTTQTSTTSHCLYEL